MNRRQFIKNSIAASAVCLLPKTVKSDEVVPLENEDSDFINYPYDGKYLGDTYTTLCENVYTSGGNEIVRIRTYNETKKRVELEEFYDLDYNLYLIGDESIYHINNFDGLSDYLEA